MGMDIHLHIADKDNNLLHKEIFEGRNSEWFNNLMGNGWDKVYDYLPIKYYYIPADFIFKNINELTDKDWDEEDKANYEKLHFGYRVMEVGAFKEWFEQYKPYLDAGWVNSYDKWAYEVKGITPIDAPKSKPEDGDDWFFITYKKNNDCSEWLYKWLLKNEIADDANIVYYFDN